MSTTLPQKSAPAGKSPAKKIIRPAAGSNLLGKLMLFIVLGGLLAAAVWGSGQYLKGLSSKEKSSVLTHIVAPGELLVTVTEDGNVESASNLDIKCQVAGGSSILWIVDDGSTVKAGDKLVELDASALEEQINLQKITYEKARSAKIQAEKNFEVAKLAVKEYIEGTFKKSLQDAEAAITIALENLRSAENSLQHAERMFRKGYVSSLELEGQRFAVERAKLELDSARTAKDVLVDFTKVKTLQELESLRDTAEAMMKSEDAAYTLEEIRLKRLESQIAQCTIVASQDGMVVYANEQGGRYGQQQATIEEGATVRERQTILRLPDLARMQVKVNVHESKIEQLRPGMRARIRILDRDMTGTVTSIANQPEATGWFSANVKEYATLVRVDGQPEGLRPGMTAEVEILVDHLTDVLTLPVAAIVEQRGKFSCWVVKPQGYEKRDLSLGLSNDQFIDVKDGVAAGETVLLNPRATVAEAKTTDDKVDAGKTDINKRFGEAKPNQAAAAGPDASQLDREASGRGESGGAAAGAGPGPGGPPEGRAEGGPGAGGPGGGRMNLKSFDKDGDGKVSREEAPEPMRDRFDSIDSNGDGFLDQADMDAMRRRFQEGGGAPGGAGGPPGGSR